MKYYLAYGSNLNKEQMAWRCPTAKPIGTATIKDYELLFKGSRSGAYLTIEKKKGGAVPVAVWEVSESDEDALDRYEGYPTFYYRKDMVLNVQRYDGSVQKMKCFVYIMHEDRKVAIPSAMYVKTCIRGYKDFGFDMDVLEEAFENSSRRGWRLVLGGRG